MDKKMLIISLSAFAIILLWILHMKYTVLQGYGTVINDEISIYSVSMDIELGGGSTFHIAETPVVYGAEEMLYTLYVTLYPIEGDIYTGAPIFQFKEGYSYIVDSYVGGDLYFIDSQSNTIEPVLSSSSSFTPMGGSNLVIRCGISEDYSSIDDSTYCNDYGAINIYERPIVEEATKKITGPVTAHMFYTDEGNISHCTISRRDSQHVIQRSLVCESILPLEVVTELNGLRANVDKEMYRYINMTTLSIKQDNTLVCNMRNVNWTSQWALNHYKIKECEEIEYILSQLKGDEYFSKLVDELRDKSGIAVKTNTQIFGRNRDDRNE